MNRPEVEGGGVTIPRKGVPLYDLHGLISCSICGGLRVHLEVAELLRLWTECDDEPAYIRALELISEIPVEKRWPELACNWPERPTPGASKSREAA